MARVKAHLKPPTTPLAEPFIYPDKREGWAVYFVQCRDKSLYCGVTNDIEHRVDAHNVLVKGGASYTRSKAPVKLVYIKYVPSKSEAMQREHLMKLWLRPQKVRAIKDATNPLAVNFVE